jgi:glycosyltransferase involved in cell wall biosynthesis
VIPLFNKEREVVRTLRSVLAQTVPAGEVVVVDDGSTDGGAEAVRALDDRRVRVISQENRGVSVARNRGVVESSGDAIAFLDADDEWKPEFLETVLSLRSRFPDAGMWATAFELIYTGDDVPKRVRCTGVPRCEEGGLIPDFFRSALKVPPVCASGFMVSREVCNDVGGFPSGVALGEDRVLWVRIALKYSVAWSPLVQVVYHKDASNRAMNRQSYANGDTELSRVLRRVLNGDLPSRLPLRSVRLLLAQHLLEVARHAVNRGDGVAARDLLREVWFCHHAFPVRCLRRWLRSYRTPR